MARREITRLLSLVVVSSVFTLTFIAVSYRNKPMMIRHSQKWPVSDGGDLRREKSSRLSANRDFLLDTPYCKIPDFDPFDLSALKYMGRDGELLCSSKVSITYVEGSVLRLNRTQIEIKFNGNFKYCQYQPIRRGKKDSDFFFEYGELSKPFDHDILVPPEDEFMRIHCYSHSEGKITTNFHAVVTPKEKVEHRSDYNFQQHLKKRAPKETYNVQMVGVDSVSRLHFMRQMQKTRQFLHNELHAFEMSGYNKVADNTFVNIVPMMMGKFVEEIGWNETMSNQPFDEYSFLWKNFSKAGYRTLYAEDAPYIAMFAYLKEGFHVPPADYYNRPLALAMEKHKSVWSKNHHCVADRPETAMLLDYVTDFSRVFKKKPYFGFTFIARLTHDSLDHAGSADFAYLKFLKRFKDEGHFNNTVLIFFSDHGYRYGPYRATYIGRVEERLPFMYFVFPPSFHEKYPRLVSNLKTNARRLTTPFDIYETLMDILYFDGVERKAALTSRGISLFREIPPKRTCEHADILPHWCVCLEQTKEDPGSELATKIATAVVSLLNAQLMSVSHLCARLALETVSDVVRMKSNDKVLMFINSINDVINRTVIYGSKAEAPVVYQLTLSTLPGQALFEATVIYEPGVDQYKLGGDISRVNAYNNQSDCVNNATLNKFCFCMN